MAYIKRYKKKYRQRRYKKKSTSSGWMNIAQKALKMAKFVAGIINAELKTYYQEVTSTSGTYTGQSWNLCNIPQGDSSNSRNGDSTKLKDLLIKGSLTYNGFNETARIIVLIDKQNALNAGTILRAPTNNNMIVYQPKNEETYYQSKVLYDKLFNVNVQIPERKFVIKIPLGFHIHFNSGSTTVNTNNVKLFYYTQEPTASAQIQFQSTVTFYDN